MDSTHPKEIWLDRYEHEAGNTKTVFQLKNYNNFMTFAGGSYVFLGVVNGGWGRQSRNLRVY